MSQMKLSEYIRYNRSHKIPRPIHERWVNRVELHGWQFDAERGARAYLKRYGKSIGVPKLLNLGSLALDNGYPDFATEFFCRAAEMQGITLVRDTTGAPVRATKSAATTPSGWPKNMQPGKFLTMQPSDTSQARKFFIYDIYWAQPKIDGVKVVIFADKDNVFYQSRTGRLHEGPDDGLDAALIKAAKRIGPFILEGELTHLDAEGNEHRTYPQAVTSNQVLKASPTAVETKVFVFSAPWSAGLPDTYGGMVDDALWVVQEVNHPVLATVKTAKDEKSKKGLAFHQQAMGHEGEVWFNPDIPYLPGKFKDERYVRTKYLTDTVVVVTGFTKSTNPEYPFGAMEVADLDGNPLGSVGTGFARTERQELLDRFNADGEFQVKVVSQGFTENGILYQARYNGEVEEEVA